LWQVRLRVGRENPIPGRFVPDSQMVRTMQANLIENPALRGDIRRALAGNHFELDGARVILPGAKVALGGVFIHTLNHADRRIDPNLLPLAALIDVLNV
jgi:hypothetical protein